MRRQRARGLVKEGQTFGPNFEINSRPEYSTACRGLHRAWAYRHRLSVNLNIRQQPNDMTPCDVRGNYSKSICIAISSSAYSWDMTSSGKIFHARDVFVLFSLMPYFLPVPIVWCGQNKWYRCSVSSLSAPSTATREGKSWSLSFAHDQQKSKECESVFDRARDGTAAVRGRSHHTRRTRDRGPAFKVCWTF